MIWEITTTSLESRQLDCAGCAVKTNRSLAFLNTPEALSAAIATLIKRKMTAHQTQRGKRVTDFEQHLKRIITNGSMAEQRESEERDFWKMRQLVEATKLRPFYLHLRDFHAVDEES